MELILLKLKLYFISWLGVLFQGLRTMAHGICNSVIYMAIYECKCPGAHTVRIYLNHKPSPSYCFCRPIWCPCWHLISSSLTSLVSCWENSPSWWGYYRCMVRPSSQGLGETPVFHKTSAPTPELEQKLMEKAVKLFQPKFNVVFWRWPVRFRLG